MNLAWLFNLGADIYAWFTAQATWRASCRGMAASIPQGAGQRVLDLGCGPGVSTFELARLMPGAHLIGLDLAPRMLHEARRRQPRAGVPTAQISWLHADGRQLPLPSRSIDACTGHSFLYLVDDRVSVLSEIRRVLRPEGRLVLMEPNARAASIHQTLEQSRDPRYLVSVSLWRPFSRLHGRFTPQTLSATLEAAGFEVCSVAETLNGLGLLSIARVRSE
jgi:ubiquinone/menaquinone biosynthesis C-methylase UbiE